jgi:predicted HicB family RNase H-like nuclease
MRLTSAASTRASDNTNRVAVARVTVTIRVMRSLHTWITAQAKKNHRSLNAEIEYRLTKQREAEEEIERKK